MFLIYTLSTLCISYLIFDFISKKIKIDSLTFNLFFFFKFTFLLLYIYSHYNNFGTDAIGYFNKAHRFNHDLLPVSDNLIYGINYFFKNFFYINFESLNILSFFVSFSSCLIFLYLTKEFDYFQKLLIYSLLLFPSLNFFTSGLNKDMLIFFSLSLFLLSIVKKNNILLVLSIILIFMIRPYVCFAILFASISCILLYNLSKIYRYKKINIKKSLIYLFFIVLSLLIIHYILDNLLGSFGKYFLKGNIYIINNLQSHYENSTLGIPVDTIIIQRMWDYFFFPSIWEKLNLNFFSIILYFESLLLVFIFIFFVFNFKFSKINNLYIFIGICSFITLYLILVLVTSNHGIAIRQKWMILPFLIIILSNKKKLL